jgi:hypothetical protein
MSKSGDPTKTGDDHDRALAGLEKALGEALARSEAAELVLDDQRQRLKALGLGREETMRALAETRDELRRVSQERDELRKQLKRVDSVQTATIALPEDDVDSRPETAEVPSLDDLMKSISQIEPPPGDGSERVTGHRHPVVQRTHELDSSEEMVAPQLVFPEQFAETVNTSELPSGTVSSCVLVLLDAEKPIRYPITKETMTIGRADIADIQIDNGFLSRLHARVVVTKDGVRIEDVESKNGIRVNSKQTPSQLLKHGDMVDLGRLRFRFLDTAAADFD